MYVSFQEFVSCHYPYYEQLQHQCIICGPRVFALLQNQKQTPELFHSLHFLLTVLKCADTCKLLLASHHHPRILSIGYLHLCPDHYLFGQSPFLPVTFLKVNIFLSAMGLNTDVLTRLGSSGEIQGSFIKSDVVVCLCL